MLRRVLFQLHLWVGLILCLPIVVIALTGSILVFEDALDDLTNPPPPKARDSGAIRTFDEIIAAARRQVSDRARQPVPSSAPAGAAGPADPHPPGARRASARRAGDHGARRSPASVAVGGL